MSERLFERAQREALGASNEGCKDHYRFHNGKSVGQLLVDMSSYVQDGGVVSDGLQLIADELDILRHATVDSGDPIDPGMIENVMGSLSQRLRILAEVNDRIAAKVNELGTDVMLAIEPPIDAEAAE